MPEEETVEIEGYTFRLFKVNEAPHLVQFIATSKNQTAARQEIFDDLKRIVQDFGKWEDISAGIELIKKL